MGFGHDPSPTQVAFIEKLLSDVPSSVWFKLIPTMLGMDVSRALDAIDVPTLVIAGEKDKLTPLAGLDTIDRECAAKVVLVLAIDVGESKKKVKQYLQQNPRSCRIVMTEDTNLAAMYQANSYPIYVVIDRDGNIAGEQRGAAGERALRGLLRRAGVRAEE